MNTILTKALNYIVGIVTENEEVKKFQRDFVTASMQWVRTWFLVDDPKAEAKINDPQRSEESKRTIIESKLEDLQDNPTFMKELAEHLAAFEAQKAKQKNALSDTDVDVQGSVHIGDKGSAGSDGYDEKNIVKGSAIKAGGDFRLGDDIVSGNREVHITHNYYGKKSDESTTLNNLATIAYAQEDYDTALRYLQQALDIQQQIGDKSGEGVTLNNISQIYNALGDYDTALAHLQQALDIQQQIGDKSGEGTTLNNLATIAYAQEDYDTALRYLQQALDIQQQIGDKSGEGTTLNNISLIYDARGDYDTALRYLQQALDIQQQIGDKSGEAATLNNISLIYDALGDYDTALARLQQALDIQQQIGDIADMATTLSNMGAMFYEQKRLEEAIPLLLQAQQILYKIASLDVEAIESYLEAIKEQIGEARFQEIITQLAQKP